jgi:hypothetical protein
MPPTLQHRESRILFESIVGKAELAKVKSGAAIGTDDANVSAVFTQAYLLEEVLQQTLGYRLFGRPAAVRRSPRRRVRWKIWK